MSRPPRDKAFSLICLINFVLLGQLTFNYFKMHLLNINQLFYELNWIEFIKYLYRNIWLAKASLNKVLSTTLLYKYYAYNMYLEETNESVRKLFI
jgi:hypothetical protein